MCGGGGGACLRTVAVGVCVQAQERKCEARAWIESSIPFRLSFNAYLFLYLILTSDSFVFCLVRCFVFILGQCGKPLPNSRKTSLFAP